ncbi:MAG: LysR family transcriptional regulator [Pseudomonadota bacterium]
MDTQSLRLFVIAAELLNISAAGRQLGLAPAVAGARLAKLENELGVELLHRSTRKVSVSLEGAEFLPFAKEILAQESAGLAALGQGSGVVSGTLRFACSSTFAQKYIVPLLPEFLELYPEIDLDLRLSDTQAKLIDGAFDLALRNLAIEDSSMIGRKLADDTRVLCASPEYLEQNGTPETPEDLIGHRLIAFGSGARTLTAQDGRECLFPPKAAKKRINCDDGTSTRLASIAGVGISMGSLWSIHQELRDGTLVRVLPEYEVKDGSAVWLVYPKSNILTPKVRVMIGFLVDRLGSPPMWEA